VDGGSDDEDEVTALDHHFLKHQNRQMAAALHDYKRRLSQSESERDALKSTIDKNAATSQVVLRSWEVLNHDMANMLIAQGLPLPKNGAETDGRAEGSSPTSSRASLPPDVESAGPLAQGLQAHGATSSSPEMQAPSPSKLRRQLSKSSDQYLFMGVEPPQVEIDVLTAVDEGADKSAGDEDEPEGAQDGNDGDGEAEGGRWIERQVQQKLNQSSELMAALLASPAYSRKLSRSNVSEKHRAQAPHSVSAAMDLEVEAGTGLAEDPEHHAESVAELLISNRALAAQVELLKDQLTTAQGAAALDRAAALHAQRGRHQAQRALDLLLADRSQQTRAEAASQAKPHATPSASPAQGASTAGAESRNGESASGTAVDAGNGHDGNGGKAAEVNAQEGAGTGDAPEEEESEVAQARDEAVALAADRLGQLERQREEVHELRLQLNDALDKASARAHEAPTDATLRSRAQRAMAEAEQEKHLAQRERETAIRVEDECRRLRSDLAAAEAQANQWQLSAEKRWADHSRELENQFQTLLEQRQQFTSQAQELEVAREEMKALKQANQEYKQLVEGQRTSLGKAQAELTTARTKAMETATAAGARHDSVGKAALDALRRLANGLSGDHKNEIEKQLGALEDGQSQLLEETQSQTEMNEALMAELETITASQTELEAQNSRLLLLASDKDEANQTLMSRTLHLRELRDAQQTEVEALKRRIASMDQHRIAQENQARARDQLVLALEKQKHELESAALTQERELRNSMARCARAQREIDEAKERCDKANGSAAASRKRMDAVTHELKELSSARDALQEGLNETERKLYKAQKKYEKAKAKYRSSLQRSTSSGNHEGGKEDDEMIELLEFENAELKKQVNCSIRKEKVKSVTLYKCGHSFSREAIDDRIANRMRRCPACNLAFATTDVRDIYLTW